MMRLHNFIRFSLLFMVFAIVMANSLTAQMTIGSNQEPAVGALLDLKEENVTTKGLLLPRVKLEKINSLRMMKGDTRNLDTKEHTGLMVYNIGWARFLCPGVHIWSGTHWDRFYKEECVFPFDKDLIETETDPSALAFSNSYMAAPHQSISFPVMKAYAAWKQIADLGNVDLSGKIHIEVLWVDKAGVLSREPYFLDGDKGKFSRIRVDMGEEEGNALIAIRIGDDPVPANNPIRWTWHLWVTDYDPEDASGQKAYNNTAFTTIFMDRSLGAMANSASMPYEAFGFNYQWGRMAPIPPPVFNLQANDSREHKPLYKLEGDVRVQYSFEKVASDNNLINAVQNPLVFYHTYDRYGDWYSSGSRKNDYLWSNPDGSKGVFDPCPPGWRVPLSGKGKLSPWFGLPVRTFDKGTGVDWSNLNDGQDAGYWPATGFRNYGAGGTINVGVYGFYWTASPENRYSFYISLGSGDFRLDGSSMRGYGFGVRCVKE